MMLPFAPRQRLITLVLLVVAHSHAAAIPSSARERPERDGSRWWLGASAVLAGTLLLDEELRSTVPEGGGITWEPLADQLNYLGNPRYLLPALAGGYATGKLARAPELSTASVHVFAALLASGVANGTVKSVVGRERPVGGDALAFRPFNLNNRWQSFPSGHAVVAFSVASAVAEEADRSWVTALSYGTASLVGWSRIYEDKHWASDVVGGALIGILASRTSLQLLHRRWPHEGEGEAAMIVFHPGGVVARIPTR